MCGVLALPQRGHKLRAGAFSFQALARRLRVFDFDVFFFGTAIVRFPRWDASVATTGSWWIAQATGTAGPRRLDHVIGATLG